MTYMLQSRVADKCITMYANTNNGTPIDLDTCNGAPEMKWHFHNGSLRSGRDYNKCLDISGVSTQNGARAILWDCHGGSNQRWTFDQRISSFRSAMNPNKCLDVNGANSANGTAIQLWDCNSTNAQKWRLNLMATDSNFNVIYFQNAGYIDYPRPNSSSRAYLPWSNCGTGKYCGRNLNVRWKFLYLGNKTTVNDPFNTFPGECVSFVKSLTGNSDNTANWRKGVNVVQFGRQGGNIHSGTAIATFKGSNGSYSGHTGFFGGYTTNGFWMYDQNWVERRVVGKHTVSVGGASSQNANADEYFILSLN